MLRDVNEIREQFGRNLKRGRLAAGLTQEELAHLAKLDRSAISLLERGKRFPRLDTLVTLRRSLELESLSELLQGIG
jgi:transcriptional regulator with XRE-family HTH domain